MNKDVIVVGGEKALTAADVRKQINLIQEIMRDVMTEGQHYGKIPGCGDKPTLLKPGAEKLSLTFRLRPIIDNDKDIVITDMSNGHREVRVYCHIFTAQGLELATGIGSCSTMEVKYRYRGGEKIPTGKPLPKEYWNLKKDEKMAEAQKLIGGPGFGPGKIEGNWEICEMGAKMENLDIADTYNTVLKMAKKRAYVDGILSATAASDIFTQDIEDIADAETIPNGGKPKVAMPKAKAKPEAKVEAEPEAEIRLNDDIINLKKARSLIGNEAFNNILGNYGCETLEELSGVDIKRVLIDAEKVYKKDKK